MSRHAAACRTRAHRSLRFKRVAVQCTAGLTCRHRRMSRHCGSFRQCRADRRCAPALAAACLHGEVASGAAGIFASALAWRRRCLLHGAGDKGSAARTTCASCVMSMLDAPCPLDGLPRRRPGLPRLSHPDRCQTRYASPEEYLAPLESGGDHSTRIPRTGITGTFPHFPSTQRQSRETRWEDALRVQPS